MKSSDCSTSSSVASSSEEDSSVESESFTSVLNQSSLDFCVQRLIGHILDRRIDRSQRLVESVVDVCDPKLKFPQTVFALFPFVDRAIASRNSLLTDKDSGDLFDWHSDDCSVAAAICQLVAEYSEDPFEKATFESIVSPACFSLTNSSVSAKASSGSGVADAKSDAKSQSEKMVIFADICRDNLLCALFVLSGSLSLERMAFVLTFECKPRSGNWILHHCPHLPVLGVCRIVAAMIDSIPLIPSCFAPKLPTARIYPCVHMPVAASSSATAVTSVSGSVQVPVFTIAFWFKLDSFEFLRLHPTAFSREYRMRLCWLRLFSEQTMSEGRWVAEALFTPTPDASVERMPPVDFRFTIPSRRVQMKVSKLRFDVWYHVCVTFDTVSTKRVADYSDAHTSVVEVHIDRPAVGCGEPLRKRFAHCLRVSDSCVRKPKDGALKLKPHVLDFQCYNGSAKVTQRVDFRVWDRVLRAEEIRQAVFGCEVTEGLQLRWEGLNCSDSRYDAKGVPKRSDLSVDSLD